MFLFVTWHGVEVYIPPLHLFSLQTSVLSFLTHNASLLFPGLPLEVLGLKNDKSTDAGECGYCKEMKYFLKRLTHLCFCTEGQDNRQVWDKKEFFFKGRCFGLSSFFCSMHFILFLDAFVYFYLVNFHHRDLEHSSVFDLPLPALCGTRSSMCFRTSVTEIKVLDQSVGGCSEMLYGMWCCVHVILVLPWLLGTQLCDLGKSFQPWRRHTAVYVQEKICITPTKQQVCTKT